MTSMALLLVAVLSLLLFGHWLWLATYWRRRGIKGPLPLPIVGNMWRFFIGRRHYGDVYQDIYNAHPELPYIGIGRFFGEPAILLRSQDMIKEVMIRSFHHFQDNVLWISPQRDPIVWCNPFVTKGDKWKQMRAEIVPIFTPNKVRSSFPHIKAICEKLAAYVEENMRRENRFEAKNLLSKYTLDVVASAAYGLNAESLSDKHSDFTQLVEHLFLPNPWSLLETIALLFSPLLSNLTKYRYAPPAVQQWLRSIIGNVLSERLPPSSSSSSPSATPAPSDFVQWLIEGRQKLHEPVDELTIVGHCSTFLLEGFETSSSLMAFALYEYATNVPIQNRVLAEIDEVMARYNGELCYEALQEMPYFEASLYETLRLHPPMMALLKHCTKEFQLPPQRPGGAALTVPVGMVCVVPVKAIHYDSDFYPEPLRFDPERFLAPSEKQRGCTFLGFGEGPRMCPGMRFGLAQSKAGLVTLLARYSVQLCDNVGAAPLQIAPTTFLTAALDGIWLSFKRRQ